MENKIKASFPVILTNDCLEISNLSQFGIYDCPISRKCKIQDNPSGLVQFTVFNPKQKKISFLKIDKCIFSDSSVLQRCDFAVFDSKTFCFVELKNSKKINKSQENRRKAKDQLINTIAHFKSKFEFSTKRIEAYVCLGVTPPRPSEKAIDLATSAEFAEISVTLYFGNEKKFN